MEAGTIEWLAVLAFAVSLPWPAILAQLASVFDARKIAKDGSANSKGKTFHRQNLTRRMIWVGLVGLLVATLTHRSFAMSALLFSSYLVYGAGLFGLTFNTFLNRRRKLHDHYVSRSDTAAKTDKAIIWLANQLGDDPEDVAAVIFPVCFWFGLIAYGLTFYFTINQ